VRPRAPSKSRLVRRSLRAQVAAGVTLLVAVAAGCAGVLGIEDPTFVTADAGDVEAASSGDATGDGLGSGDGTAGDTGTSRDGGNPSDGGTSGDAGSGSADGASDGGGAPYPPLPPGTGTGTTYYVSPTGRWQESVEALADPREGHVDGLPAGRLRSASGGPDLHRLPDVLRGSRAEHGDGSVHAGLLR
jgi:hypothetical protein